MSTHTEVSYYDTLAHSPEFPYILLGFMLRNREVCASLVNSIDITDFDCTCERGMQFCVTIIQGHWEKCSQLVPRNILESMLYHVQSHDVMPMNPGEFTALLARLRVIFETPESEFKGTYILEPVQRFIATRRLGPLLNASVGLKGSELMERIQELSKSTNAVRIARRKDVDIANFEDEAMLMPDRAPTGTKHIDFLLGGGLLRTETVGIMAPTGGGKTTTAVQIVASMAKLRKHVVYVTYEVGANPGITTRIRGSVAEIPRSEMEGVQSIKELPEEYRERLYRQRDIGTFDFIHIIDMKDDTIGSAVGSGGVEELTTALMNRFEDKGISSVDAIIIDQLKPMVENYMIQRGKSPNDLRHYMEQITRQIGDLATAGSFNTTVFLLHQMKSAFCAERPQVLPTKGDAMDNKSFPSWMQACIAYGTLDVNKRCWCRLVKGRDVPEGTTLVTQLDGENYCFRCDLENPDRYKPSGNIFIDTQENKRALGGDEPAKYKVSYSPSM